MVRKCTIQHTDHLDSVDLTIKHASSDAWKELTGLKKKQQSEEKKKHRRNTFTTAISSALLIAPRLQCAVKPHFEERQVEGLEKESEMDMTVIPERP